MELSADPAGAHRRPGPFESRRGGPPRDQNRISLHLAPEDYRALAEAAGREGMPPWKLLLRWTQEHLAELNEEVDEDEDALWAEVDDLRGQVNQLQNVEVPKLLGALRREFERQLKERIATPAATVSREDFEALSRQVTELASKVEAHQQLLRAASAAGAAVRVSDTAGSRPRVAPTGRRTAPKLAAKRSERSRRQRPSRAKPRTTPRLHEEIAAVLAEAGQPMTPQQIANRIRERGQFRSTRGGKEATPSMVSTRVANAAYRGRFRRSGDVISLAQ